MMKVHVTCVPLLPLQSYKVYCSVYSLPYLYNTSLMYVQVNDYSTWRIPSMSSENPNGYLVKQIKESCTECRSTIEESAMMATQSECKL